MNDLNNWIPESMLQDIRATFSSREQIDALRMAFSHAADARFFDLLDDLIETDQRDTSTPVTCPVDPAKRDAFMTHLASYTPPSPAGESSDILPGFGTLWTTCGPEHLRDINLGINRSMPSVVVSDLLTEHPEQEQVLQVIPISDYEDMASDDDLILPAGNEHGSLILEVWNEQPMCTDQLYRCIGYLDEGEMRTLFDTLKKNRCNAGDSDRSITAPLNTDPVRLFRQWRMLTTFFLRQPALDLLASARNEETAEESPIMLFPDLMEQELQLAAASDKAAFVGEWVVPEMNLTIQAQADFEYQEYTLTVFDADGEASHALDDYALCLPDGSETARIANGQARIAFERLIHGMYLAGHDGRPIGMNMQKK
ncbi:MAG: hypothetical protein EOL87_13805 [Spartobacteria bacterium]|nr:hypothetical protein [Spartobacteria bacterium]